MDVVTLGESMGLLPPRQQARSAHTFSRGLGGAESNVAIGLARLGKKAGCAPLHFPVGHCAARVRRREVAVQLYEQRVVTLHSWRKVQLVLNHAFVEYLL